MTDSTVRIGSFYGFQAGRLGGDLDGRDIGLHSTGIELDYTRTIRGLADVIRGGGRLTATSFFGSAGKSPAKGFEGGLHLLTGAELFALGDFRLEGYLSTGLFIGSLDVAGGGNDCPEFGEILSGQATTRDTLKCHLQSDNGSYTGKSFGAEVDVQWKDYVFGLWGQFGMINKRKYQELPESLVGGGMRIGFAF